VGSDQCTFTVTVGDNEAPTFTCPTLNLTLNTTGGSDCQVQIPDLVALVLNEADNCALRTTNPVTQSIAAGNYDGVSDGMTIPVTLTVTDNATPANTATCVVTFTVNDDDAPTLTCPPNATISTLSGNACAVNIPNYANMLAPTDNCTAAGDILENQDIPPGTYTNGVVHGAQIALTYTATDGAVPANTATCVVTLTVSAPEANVQGNGTTIADGDNTPDLADHTYFFETTLGNPLTRTFTIQNTGGEPLTISSIVSSNNTEFYVTGPLSPAGPIPAGQSATFTVTFNPTGLYLRTSVLTITTNDCDEAAYDFVISGTVNCISPSTTPCPTAQTVNTAPGQCTAVVNYAATISGNPVPAVSYTFVGATSGSGAGTGTGAVFQRGVTQVTFSATNDCGTATCQFNVTVVDNQPPVLTCPASIVQPNSLNQCGRTVGYGHTLSDNCASPVLTYTMSGAVTGSGAGSGSSTYFPVGTTTVVLNATDGTNAVQCSFMVTINDTQLPGISCPASVSVSNTPGQCGATVIYATPTASDNCSGVGLDYISGGLSGSFFDIGTTTVQWMATDATNNTKTCTFNITVSDVQLPSITCPAQQSRNTDAGACTALTTYAAPTVSDNCTTTPPALTYNFSGATATAGYAAGTGSGSTFNKGITTVTLRATDLGGLTRSCTFRVVVTDAQPPVITCPPNQSVNTAATSCTSAAVTYATPTATDNCTPAPTVTRTSGPASGSAFPTGTTNVVWRATDGAARTATCAFSVTVTDNTPPSIACPPSMSVAGSGMPCAANVTYASPTASDNCGTPTVFLQSGLASGSAFGAGTTVNIWRATDTRGTTSTCSFSITVTCSSSRTASVAERDSKQTTETNLPFDFTLSPNPAHQQVLVSLTALPETLTEGQLLVYDAQGRLYQQQALTAGTQSVLLPVEAWPAGLYWISVQAGAAKATKRLAVQRF
jgi:hypothetical protein